MAQLNQRSTSNECLVKDLQLKSIQVTKQTNKLATSKAKATTVTRHQHSMQRQKKGEQNCAAKLLLSLYTGFGQVKGNCD